MSPRPAHSDLSSRTSVGRLLKEHGLRPRKSLGQHFLIDRSVLSRIVETADLRPEDIVIEVGPGPGVLTRELLKAAHHVVAIEKDERMAELLEADLGGDSLSVVRGDVLQVSIETLLPIGVGDRGYKVVANLPYYAAAAILRRFLEADSRPSLLVLLLQREVAESLTAQPGKMSMLAVATQLYAVPKLVATVQASSFYPPPKVDSAIVGLAVRPQPIVEVEPGLLFRVAGAGFSAPRKQIANALANGLRRARGSMLPALVAADVNPQRRAETLSLEEWGRLARALEGVLVE